MVQSGGSHPRFFLQLTLARFIVFWKDPKAALSASKDFDKGHYKTVPQHGIRAFGRAYSAWHTDKLYVSDLL